MGDSLESSARSKDIEPHPFSRFCEDEYLAPQSVRSDLRSGSDVQVKPTADSMPLADLKIVDSGMPHNVSLDRDGFVAKIQYPAEGKTREFGRDQHGEINKLVTTTPKGQYTYTKENGDWIYNAPDGNKFRAPNMMLDDNGDFSKVVDDGVALTQRPDGSTYEEEINAAGARIHRDADGRPDSVKRPDCSSIRAEYEGGKLSKVIERQDGQSITWSADKDGNWKSDQLPPQTVRDMKVEKNGNLSYSAGDAKYTIRANGAELKERADTSKYAFDEQGRIKSFTSADGKSTMSFAYKGLSDEPAAVHIADGYRNTSSTYVHSPEKGGWTHFDLNNRNLGVWKGDIKLQDDGTYSFKAKGDGWTDHYSDGKDHKDSAPAADLAHYPELPPERSHRQTEPSNTSSDRTVSINASSDQSVSTNASGDRSVSTSTPGGRSDSTNASDGKPESTTLSDNRPAQIVDDTVERTDHSVHLTGFMLPSPDQLGAGSCLYMSATGIAEFLLNKSRGIAHPQVGGETDLSEQWTINLAKTTQLGNAYTDAPELLKAGGAKLDREMPFKQYDSSSWMNEPAIGGRGSVQIPAHKRDVLFSAGGESTQNTSGVMRPEHLQNIKKYLRDHESPVLLTWKAPTTNYWHACVVTGYDDKTQQLTVRDSSFGAGQSNLPRYNYGGPSRYGAREYKGEWQMPYSQVLQWGNHATGYRLD